MYLTLEEGIYFKGMSRLAEVNRGLTTCCCPALLTLSPLQTHNQDQLSTMSFLKSEQV